MSTILIYFLIGIICLIVGGIVFLLYVLHILSSQEEHNKLLREYYKDNPEEDEAS